MALLLFAPTPRVLDIPSILQLNGSVALLSLVLSLYIAIPIIWGMMNPGYLDFQKLYHALQSIFSIGSYILVVHMLIRVMFTWTQVPGFKALEHTES